MRAEGNPGMCYAIAIRVAISQAGNTDSYCGVIVSSKVYPEREIAGITVQWNDFSEA